MGTTSARGRPEPGRGKNFSGCKDARVLVVDEVQEIADWERAVASILKSGKADIYVTGSNARIFSTELSDRLSRRHVEIPAYPLNLCRVSGVFPGAGTRKRNSRGFWGRAGCPPRMRFPPGTARRSITCGWLQRASGRGIASACPFTSSSLTAIWISVLRL